MSDICKACKHDARDHILILTGWYREEVDRDEDMTKYCKCRGYVPENNLDRLARIVKEDNLGEVNS